MKRQQRNAGFTLVELLVVVGIVAVLIAMIMPALNKAREAAKKVQCLSNLRQLTVAAQMFANANKQSPPPPFLSRWTIQSSWWVLHQDMSLDSFNTPPTGMRRWEIRTYGGHQYTGMMWPNLLLQGNFIGNDKVVDCPSFRQMTHPSVNRTNLSYGMNAHAVACIARLMISTSIDPNPISEYRQPYFQYQVVKFGKVREASKGILFSDRVMVNPAHWSDSAAINWFAAGQYGWNDIANPQPTVWFHGDGINVSFYDGSARFVTKKEAYFARTTTADLVWDVNPNFTSWPLSEYGRPVN
jgi:prepilin-type N-terminal cleavage/methylation domain-containing protein/prepilin-type processing-associated H-X9-DG protein